MKYVSIAFREEVSWASADLRAFVHVIVRRSIGNQARFPTSSAGRSIALVRAWPQLRVLVAVIVLAPLVAAAAVPAAGWTKPSSKGSRPVGWPLTRRSVSRNTALQRSSNGAIAGARRRPATWRGGGAIQDRSPVDRSAGDRGLTRVRRDRDSTGRRQLQIHVDRRSGGHERVDRDRGTPADVEFDRTGQRVAVGTFGGTSAVHYSRTASCSTARASADDNRRPRGGLRQRTSARSSSRRPGAEAPQIA